MRLLEMFTLLELRDRLAHIADTMQGKIAQRWEQHVQEAGFVGLPQEWKAMYRDGKLPDESVMSVDGWAKGWPGLNDMARSVVEWFASHDPTKNKKYTDWLLRQWLKERVYLEDVYKAHNTLEAFEEHRKKLAGMDLRDMEGDPIGPPPQRRADINAWQDYATLAYAMRPLVGTRAAGEKVQNFLAKPEIQHMMSWPVPDPVEAFGENGEWDIETQQYAHQDATGEAPSQFDTMDWYDFAGGEEAEATTAIKKIYADDKLAVLQPNTRAAACELGRGTEWCTAATQSENYFWHYAPDGPLYVLLTDKHGKFQFHFDSKQFMDVHDVPITDEVKAELVREYPQLRKIFAQEAWQRGVTWLMDPDDIDLDTVEQGIEADPMFTDMDDSSGFPNIREMVTWPKIFDGQADEQALAKIEDWIRFPMNILENWQHLRHPTEADYQAALTAEDRSIRGYDPSSSIIRSAQEHGVNLSDETLEMLVARSGETIHNMPLERLQANPQWLLGAIQNQPRVLENILQTAMGTTGWGDLVEPHEVEHAKALVNMLLQSGEAGRKAVGWALHHVPDMGGQEHPEYQAWMAQQMQGQEQGQNQGDPR